MSLLVTQNLIKTYDGRRVVDCVGFEVGEREIVGLLGRNGAGKTTSFRITVGMIASDEGRVRLASEDISHLPMYQRARRGMGYLSQEPSVFQRLSVEDNLLAILETLKDLSAAERRRQAGELMERFGLKVNARQLARTLSGGERRKLEIARALITKPRLLLLDEPFSGVDPIAVHDLQRDILKLRDERGISILLTDHNVREILTITDRTYILDEGKVLRHGTPKELITDEVVRRTYLGDTFRGDEFD